MRTARVALVLISLARVATSLRLSVAAAPSFIHRPLRSAPRAPYPYAMAKKKKSKEPPPPPPETFEELGASPKLVESLSVDCVRPMESQLIAWPALRETDTDIADFRGGSGKALAYLLPLIDQLVASDEARAAAAVRHCAYMISSRKCRASPTTFALAPGLVLRRLRRTRPAAQTWS